MKKPTWRIRELPALAAAIPLATLALCLIAGLAPFHRTAGAVCSDNPTDDITFPTAVTPAPDGFSVQGPAPLLVVMAFDGNEVVVPNELTSSLDWGDGSGGQPLTIVSCGDDVYSWPPQRHSHTYRSPGDYVVLWKFNTPTGLPVVLPNIPVLFVHVGTATPTAAPSTPTPIAQTPAPTAAGATPTASPSGVSPTAVQETPSVAASATGVPSATASSAPVTATATATSTPVPASPTQAPVLAASTSTPETRLPEFFRDVPDPGDISTDPGVVSTNVVLAGMTVWVFFSSVLFNQTLQQHREEVSAWTRRIRPRVRAPRLAASGAGALGVATWAIVLAGTGFIYGLLEPSFGWNRASFVLFTSVVLGVGAVGSFYSGLEAWSRRSTLGVAATVRAYPFSLVVAVICVASSRLLNLHPGVIYGFAASCVVMDTAGRNERHEGRALVVPVVACLALSVLCWLVLAPLRAASGDLFAEILQGVAIIVFVGGLEGLFVNLIPLDVMDGAKIYRWNRRIWIALVLVTAFLVWHVLLNSQASGFESVRQASSLSVLAAFAAYTAAGVGFWGFFAIRDRRQRPRDA